MKSYSEPKAVELETFIGARINALTIFHYISKVRELAYTLCRSPNIMNTLVEVSNTMDSTSNGICLAIIANLSRHPANAHHLVFNVSDLILMLVNGMNSDTHEDRIHACFAIQNLSCDKECALELCYTSAATNNTATAIQSHSREGTVSSQLIASLSKCIIRQESHPKEKLAAMGAMRNLSQDLADFVHFSSVEGCMNTVITAATTLVLSDSDDADKLRFLACDTLATIAHWMMYTAERGTENKKQDHTENIKASKPTLRVTHWNQWE